MESEPDVHSEPTSQVQNCAHADVVVSQLRCPCKMVDWVAKASRGLLGTRKKLNWSQGYLLRSLRLPRAKQFGPSHRELSFLSVRHASMSSAEFARADTGRGLQAELQPPKTGCCFSTVSLRVRQRRMKQIWRKRPLAQCKAEASTGSGLCSQEHPLLSTLLITQQLRKVWHNGNWRLQHVAFAHPACNNMGHELHYGQFKRRSPRPSQARKQQCPQA